MRGIFVMVLLMLGLYSTVNSDVVIEKGDVIKVYVIDSHGTDIVANVYSQNNAQGAGNIDPHEVVVSSEGKVYIPNIGLLSVADKKTSEVEKMIISGLSPTIALQQVAVLLMTPKFNRIYVLGEVRNPGMYKIDQTKSYESKLMNLISSAGGFSDRANKQNIKIVKDNGQAVTVNLMEMVRLSALKDNLDLGDKDTIIVGQSLSRIYVIGEVRTPGGFPFIEGANFADYIAEAGGLGGSAAMDNIGIVRKDAKTSQVYKVALDGSFSANGDSHFALQPGDIVYVPKNFFSDWKDIGNILGIARDSVYVYDTVRR